MNHYFNKNKIRIACLLLLLILSVARIYTEKKYSPAGDAIEYTLMTEAFYNHFTPEVKETDYVSFKNAYSKITGWENNDKAIAYDSVGKFLAQKNFKNLEYKYAFFADKAGRKYSCHFWFYSLLNLPVRWVCAIIPFNSLCVFYITNLLLILLTCCVFFKTSRFGQLETAALCVLFFYSANYWYFCWSHPEVFTACFVAMGVWLFLHEKWYVGILLVAVAALQNQPLGILTGVMVLIVLFNKGIRFKNLALLFFSACLIFLPSLFYWCHYGVTNLIGYEGALSTSRITITRVVGFFFDLNQGMILALPLILLLYLFLYARKIFKIREAETKWDLLLLPAMVFVVCGASTIDNWNHGQAVVSRYVTYVEAIALVHFFYLLMELKSEKVKWIILSLSLLSQVSTVYYHQKLTHYDNSTYQPKPLSNWVLAHFPALYNPDPVIFNTRYFTKGLEMDIAASPAYFMKPDGQITKFLVYRWYVDNLQKYGLTKKQIDSIGPTLSYTNDWAYITVTNKLKLRFSNAELKRIDAERQLKIQILKIRSIPEWYAAVKEKAFKQGITEDDALRNDAAYVLHISLPLKSEEEQINDKIIIIKSDPGWLKLVEAKAAKAGITIDSALYNDARTAIEQDANKNN